MTESSVILTGAARATLEGAAEVSLSQSFEIEGAEPRSFSLSGVADLARDRCRLVGEEKVRADGEVFIFDRGDEYRLLDGRWHLRRHRVNRRAPADPAWILGLLADERSIEEVREGPNGEIHGQLAHESADATSLAGISPDWTLPFTVVIIDGRVRSAHLETVDRSSGQLGTVGHLELTPIPSVAPIELPPSDVVVLDDIATEIDRA